MLAKDMLYPACAFLLTVMGCCVGCRAGKEVLVVEAEHRYSPLEP